MPINQLITCLRKPNNPDSVISIDHSGNQKHTNNCTLFDSVKSHYQKPLAKTTQDIHKIKYQPYTYYSSQKKKTMDEYNHQLNFKLCKYGENMYETTKVHKNMTDGTFKKCDTILNDQFYEIIDNGPINNSINSYTIYPNSHQTNVICNDNLYESHEVIYSPLPKCSEKSHRSYFTNKTFIKLTNDDEMNKISNHMDKLNINCQREKQIKSIQNNNTQVNDNKVNEFQLMEIRNRNGLPSPFISLTEVDIIPALPFRTIEPKPETPFLLNKQERCVDYVNILNNADIISKAILNHTLTDKNEDEYNVCTKNNFKNRLLRSGSTQQWESPLFENIYVKHSAEQIRILKQLSRYEIDQTSSYITNNNSLNNQMNKLTEEDEHITSVSQINQQRSPSICSDGLEQDLESDYTYYTSTTEKAKKKAITQRAKKKSNITDSNENNYEWINQTHMKFIQEKSCSPLTAYNLAVHNMSCSTNSI